MKKDVAELKKELEEVEALYEETKHTLDSDNRWRSYLVFLVIFSSLSSCFTLSKYMSSIQSENSVAQVAKFDVNVSSDLYVPDNPELSRVIIGYLPVEKNIKISNKSDVNVDVTIDSTITLNGAPSDKFTISVDDEEYKTNGKITLGMGNTSKDNKNKAAPTSGGKKTKQLKIIIEPNPKSSYVSQPTDVYLFNINVHSEQVD